MLDGEQDGASGVSCMARKEILGKENTFLAREETVKERTYAAA